MFLHLTLMLFCWKTNSPNNRKCTKEFSVCYVWGCVVSVRCWDALGWWHSVKLMVCLVGAIMPSLSLSWWASLLHAAGLLPYLYPCVCSTHAVSALCWKHKFGWSFLALGMSHRKRWQKSDWCRRNLNVIYF